jgi:adenosylcobinamide-phosphate synthase
MGAALAVLVALALDRLWGEPPVWLHPVVWMGRLLGATGRWIAPRAPVCRGGMRLPPACWPGARWQPWWADLCRLQLLLPPQPWWLAGALAGVLLKPLLSWRMLKDEVLAVEAALQQSLPAGRERLSWLVSRDTAQLDAATVRESAIETWPRTSTIR